MITKTESGEHNGWPWEITVTKSKVGTYTATAIVSCQMQTVRLAFPSGDCGGPCHPNNPAGSGSYLSENPYAAIVEYVCGFIDGRNDAIANTLITGDKDELKKLISEDTTSMKPLTDATPEQLEAMQSEVDRLVDTFGAVGVAHLSGVTPDGVRKWKNRGRVSATMAHKLCLIPAVSEAGFTRESLRPDVVSWVQMDYPAAVK